MGAWGIRALESDEGLDVIDFLTDSYLPEHTVINMEDIISALKEESLLGETFEQIDFLYDNTAMALAELYLEWIDSRKLNYDDEASVWSKITDFITSQDALAFLLRYLHDIRNEVPDEDGGREIIDLWRDSDSWEKWSNHLDMLIQRLSKNSHLTELQ